MTRDIHNVDGTGVWETEASFLPFGVNLTAWRNSVAWIVIDFDDTPAIHWWLGSVTFG